MTKCMLAGNPGVSAKEYIELLEASGVDLDEKEIAKIDKMTNEMGIIDKSEFLAYAKKSSVFKNLLEGEKHNFDKAELAFKVRSLLLIIIVEKESIFVHCMVQEIKYSINRVTKLQPVD